jgi:hypothetical protein
LSGGPEAADHQAEAKFQKKPQHYQVHPSVLHLSDLEHPKAGGVEEPEGSKRKMRLLVVSHGEKRGARIKCSHHKLGIPRKQIPILVLGEAHISRSEQYRTHDSAALVPTWHGS